MKRRRVLPSLAVPAAAILFVCAVFPAVAQAQSISVGSASGTPGSTVTLAVNFTPGTTGVSALSFDLTYPATLTFLPPPPDITGSAALAAGKSTSANFHSGVLTILVFGLNRNAIGAGDIAQLRFSISGSATPGTISVNISNASGTDADANPVAVSLTPGLVTVNAGADTTPPAITGVASGSVSSSGATITWTTNEPANSQVEYGATTSYGSTTALDASMATTHSVGIAGLAPGTLYHYRVKSADASGNLATSNDYTFTTGTLVDTTPPTITGVASSSVSSSGATITWTTNEPANSQVEYGTATTYGSTSALNPSMFTSHSVGITGLAPSTLYHYRVESADSSGNLAVSNDFTFTTTGTTVDTTPPTISGVASSNVTSSSAAINWTTNELANSQVEYGTTMSYGSTTTLNPSMVTSHSAVITGLQPNTLYHYRVRSADASDNLAVSNDYGFRTVTTSDTTPPVITGVSSSAVTATGATVSWTTNEPADSQVEFGTTGSYGRTTSVDPAMVTSHSAGLSGLTPGTSYHYRVKSKDAAGNLAVSIDYTFATTPGSNPGAPVISEISTTAIGMTRATITWVTDKPANSMVEYGVTTSYGSSTTLDTLLVTTHSQTLTGLDPSTRYHFRVKSTDAAGNLAASSDRSFDTTPVPPGTPPSIGNVQASHITDTVAVITWSTNLLSTSQVEYGPSGYGHSTPTDANYVKSHKQTLTGLSPDTTYVYRVMSATRAGDLAVSDEWTFKTMSGNEPIDVQLTLSYPRSLSSGPGIAGSPNEEFIGIALVNLGTSPATLRFTACDPDGNPITGANIINPVRRMLLPGEQLPVLDSQLFGNGFVGPTNGSVKIESDVPEVAGFYMVFDAALNILDGTTMSPAALDYFLFPEIDARGYTRIELVNPGDLPATVTLELVAVDGTVRSRETLAIPAHGASSPQLSADVFQGLISAETDYIRGSSDRPMVPLEMFGKTGTYTDGLNAQDGTNGSTKLYSPQFVYGNSWTSRLSVVNLDPTPGSVTFRLIGENGVQIGSSKVIPIGSYGRIRVDDTTWFGGSTPGGGSSVTQGYVEISGNGMRLAGDVVFGDSARNRFSSSLPLVSQLASSLLFAHVTSSDLFFTGISVLNPNPSNAIVTIDLYTDNGTLDASTTQVIPARQRISGVLTQLFPHLAGQNRTSGYIRISADRGVASFALFGTHSLNVLSAIPAQVR